MTASRARHAIVAVIVPAVAALPVMFLGALSVLIQQDLSIQQAEYGALVASYFASAALMAVPAGRLAERIGPRSTTWLGLACTAVSLGGIATLAHSASVLFLLLIVGGAGSTTSQLGVSVLVTRSVPARRRGVVFGINKAAVPLAALIAGASVPVIGLTLGWRWVFALGVSIVPLAAMAMVDAHGRSDTYDDVSKSDARHSTLLLLAMGVALASAGGNAGAAFLVPSSVDVGATPALAGFFLSIASLTGLLVRVAAGWLGDVVGEGALFLIVSLVIVGAVGYVGLATSVDPYAIALSSVLAFGGGWGWAGLILLAVSRSSPNAPGPAMGLVHVGTMIGAVVGPLAFGAMAQAMSFSASWLMMAVFALVGAATILIARRKMAGDKRFPGGTRGG